MKRSAGRRAARGLATMACWLFAAVSLRAQSNEITIQPSNPHAGDTVQIVVTLNGAAASVDEISLPLTNLIIDNGPSVASQFQWINGDMSRQKVFTYSAHADHPGVASAGPLVLDRNNHSLLVPEVQIQVLPELEVSAGSPEEALRELQTARRERVFIMPEIDRKSVRTGEQLVVTWYLYSADSVRDLEIRSMPTFTDFWAEELPVKDEPTRELNLGGMVVQKVPIRRLALFPLHSGHIVVGPLAAVVEIIEPARDPFGFFSLLDRTVQTVDRRSPKIDVDVTPLPAGTYDAVGSFVMSCSAPRTSSQGPVVINVQLAGRGNLRSASAPRMTGQIDGRLEVQDGPVSVDSDQSAIRMTRSWKFLIFPAKAGMMHIPSLTFRTFDPEATAGRELQCDASDVRVENDQNISAAGGASGAVLPEPSESSDEGRWLGLAVTGVALIAIIAWIVARRPRFDRKALAELTASEPPSELRRRLYALVEARKIEPRKLIEEASERGDSYRSLHSYIDLEERESLTRTRSEEELRRRAREFLIALQRRR